MNKYFFLAIFLLCFVPNGNSQTDLSDFSYVIVPEQFEYFDQKDKYQLNSIAEFLFNKHGFHAFKSNNTPDAKRCDGLYADIEKLTAMLRTKLVVVLKDCNGFEIYRTEPGVSKFKEFKRAYQDALRKAFLSFEDMNVRQKEITYFDETPSAVPVAVTKVEKTPPTVTSEPYRLDEVDVEPPITKEVIKTNLPKDRFTSYTRNSRAYVLRKTVEGYFFYEEAADAEGGLLLKGRVEAMTAEKIYFTDQDNNLFKASFDASGNLIIQKGDSSEVYKRVR